MRASIRKSFTIIGAAALGACLGAGPSEPIPARPEKIEFRPLAFDPPSAQSFRRVTASGVPVYLAPSEEFPLIQVIFSFKGGDYLDPPGKVGLARTTGAMIRRGGTASVSAGDLDEKFDFLAAQCATACGSTMSTASLNCLKSNFDEAFALFIDMLKSPGFQEDKVDVFRSEVIEEMKQRNDDAGPILEREWSALLFGRDHFEAREPTKASVESITTSDMREFASRVFNPGNLIIGVTGDFAPDEMMARLERALAGWPKGERAADVPAPTAQLTPGVYRVEKDIPQGKVALGMRGVKRDDPDYFPLLIMNDVLGGGGFTSRITSRVRSDEGLAYHASSGMRMPYEYPGEFRAEFQSKNPTCALATKIIFEEIERIRREPVGAKDLDTSKNQFIETFPRTFESKVGMINVFINDEWTNRDPNYWKTYRDRIKAVTAADVTRVAKERLRPEEMAIVVVGKWSEIGPGDLEGRAKMGQFFGGRDTALPLRDPLTMEPMSADQGAR